MRTAQQLLRGEEGVEELGRQLHVATEAGPLARLDDGDATAPLDQHDVTLAQRYRQTPEEGLALTARRRQLFVAGGSPLSISLRRASTRTDTAAKEASFSPFSRLRASISPSLAAILSRRSLLTFLAVSISLSTATYSFWVLMAGRRPSAFWTFSCSWARD